MRGPGGTDVVSNRTSVDGRVISDLRSEWETETIQATGSAPVINRYPDAARNRELARRGAILDGQRNLAEQVSRIRISATVTMADLATSEFVRSQMNAVVQDVQVTNERYDEQNGRYEVTVSMPKLKVLTVVEEYARRF